MSLEIYEPAEDSYLISEILRKKMPRLLEKNPKLKILEIGSGSGIQLQTLKKLGIKKENIFSCDINPDAVRECEKLGFNCIQSDLFEKINGTYDIIIFNPPYLPKDKNEPKSSRLATTGGKTGSEIINKFLKQAGKHLKKDGKIFLLTSSLTKGIQWKNWERKKLGEKKLFMEKLEVWELRQ